MYRNMLLVLNRYLKNSQMPEGVLKVIKYFMKLEDRKMLSIFEDELKNIDAKIKDTAPRAIPELLKNIPLDLFGKLLLDIPAQYPNIKDFFPSMASDEIQDNWTGTHGDALLNQSLAFIKTMIYGYTAVTGNKIEKANILDYGCGWGRLIRLMYKFVSIENIYGVDPWDESIKICRQNGIKGNLAISEYVPVALPFERQFDLIFAFSVFTHLSEKTAHTVLNTLRRYVSTDGVLVITIRPKEFWSYHRKGTLESGMKKAHEAKGFAFTPHNRTPVDGDVTYGDTSMTLAYITDNFPQWQIEMVEWNEIDPYQVIVFLKPV